jgi:hypothetical protein
VKHLNGTTRSLERVVLPILGPLPIAGIKPAMITTVIKSILARGGRKGGRSRHQTAVKVLQHLSKIFSYASERPA